MRSVNLRLTSSTGCQHVKRGPKTILLKLLTILLSGSPFRWWTRQQLTAGLIPQLSQLKRSMSLARRPFRVISARTVELAGTNQFRMFATVNTKKGGLKGERVRPQPIRPQKNSLRNKDPVISNPAARTATGACTGSGPLIWFFQDHQWKQRHDPSFKPQAPSTKHHAPIFRKHQASSTKRQAFEPTCSIAKRQASQPE